MKDIYRKTGEKIATLAVLALSAAAFGQRPANSSESLPDAPSLRFEMVHSAAGWAGNALPASHEEPVTLRNLPLLFLKDEVAIFTSPARIRKDDLRWLLPLAGATAASLSTDTHTMRTVVSRNPDFNNANGTASDALRGVAIGIPVMMFAVGAATHHEAPRETGVLAGEAMIDAIVFDEVIKFATLRERPNKNNAEGHFFTGEASSDPSFVSGHSIVAWSSAAVLAEEYRKPWQRIGIYTLASGASLTRVLGQQHFPTDALLGSAAGWLIGHYVYKTHHRPRIMLNRRSVGSVSK